MKQIFILFAATIHCIANEPSTENNVLKFSRKGLPAMMSFIVVDETGNPIPGVSASCSWELLGEKYVQQHKSSNIDGLVVFSGNVLTRARVRFAKDGYYDSVFEQKYLERDRRTFNEGCAAGKWLPWNPTNRIVLREKNESADVLSRWLSTLTLPPDGEIAALDLEKGILVEPSNTTADILVDFSVRHDGDDWERSLVLSATNSVFDGFMKLSLMKESGSICPFLTSAPENGYTNVLTLGESFKDGVFESTELGKNTEYVVFRVRAKKDKSGAISGLHGIVVKAHAWESNDGRRTLDFTYCINTNRYSTLLSGDAFCSPR